MLYNATIHTPTVAILDKIPIDLWKNELKPQLEYKVTEVKQLLNRHRQNYAWKRSNLSTWTTKFNELEKACKIPLYSVSNVDESQITIRCRPGSIAWLKVQPTKLKNLVKYPILDERRHVFKVQFPFSLYPYQKESIENLLIGRHGNVELCTGSGKSAIALHLVKLSGLRCVIIVPGKENCTSLYSDFVKYFGNDKVGMYGDGKKELHKDITICIGKSLAMLNKVKHKAAWDFFSTAQLMIVDESHTFVAKTMAEVCHGILGAVPYRFFLSGTQERGEDEENLLRSVIGKCVRALTTKDAVLEGYISHHQFVIVQNVPSYETNEQCDKLCDAQSNNPLQVRRIAFLHNTVIARIIAQRALRDINQGIPSLILVDEVGQVALLVQSLLAIDNGFNVGERIAFAHGEVNKLRLAELRLPANNSRSVEQAIVSFNKGEKLLMIATSCIQTGASLFPVQVCYNFVGGGASNRVRTCQGPVGRSVRKWDANPYKDCIPKWVVKKESALIIDFDVDEPQMKKHLAKRLLYYGISGTPITHVDLLDFQ